MIELAMLFAAALAEPTPAPAPASVPVPESPAAAREDPPIDVRGQRVTCRRTTAHTDSRIFTGRVCLTQREWDEQHDRAVELYHDMPRRNPRQAGRTIPDPRDITQ